MSFTAAISGTVPWWGWSWAIKTRLARIRELVPARQEVSERAALLLMRHGDSVLRCAYSYLHNSLTPRKCLQDTLVQYLRTSPELNDAQHERAWLLRVAANLEQEPPQIQRCPRYGRAE